MKLNVVIKNGLKYYRYKQIKLNNILNIKNDKSTKQNYQKNCKLK